MVVFVLLSPKYLLHMRRRGGYWPGFWQRFAHYRPEVRRKLESGNSFWIHAVSVGEVFVALKFMKALRGKDPGLRFALSVTTSTGHAVAARSMAEDDQLIYFPIDFPPILRRTLNIIRPSAVAIVETELWPNLIRMSAARGIPVYLVNGRLSDSSYRGYRRLRPLTRSVLSCMTKLYVQSQQEKERFVDIGAAEERIMVTGSAKYDVAHVDPRAGERGEAILRGAGIAEGALCLLGASTWPGEEEALLRIYRHLRVANPRLRLLLAPRHAERRARVTQTICEQGFKVVLRSEQQAASVQAEDTDVLLLDTTGELQDLYACAEVVFVGKSLTRRGGQNPIEPAAYGRAVVTGPHMDNFRNVMRDFEERQAVIRVHDEEQLGQVIGELFADSERRAALGERARETVAGMSGAVLRMVADIARHVK